MNLDEVDVKANGEESLSLGSKEAKAGRGSLGAKDLHFTPLWRSGAVR